MDYGDWRRVGGVELEDRYAQIYGYLSEYEERRDHFLQAGHRLTRAFLLVRHLEGCRPFADEIIFYQRVRKQLLKALPGLKVGKDPDQAVRDLVDDTVESEEVVIFFQVAGIERADISILDEKFLETFKNKPLENLRVKLLEKLVRHAIQRRQPKNLAKARSFRELLEKTLQQYHNRLITAAAVIEAMLRIRREVESDDRGEKEGHKPFFRRRRIVSLLFQLADGRPAGSMSRWPREGGWPLERLGVERSCRAFEWWCLPGGVVRLPGLPEPPRASLPPHAEGPGPDPRDAGAPAPSSGVWQR